MNMGKIRKLTQLRIDEVSSVLRGAGEGVKVVLMKRDDGGENRVPPSVDAPPSGLLGRSEGLVPAE